MNRTTCEAGSTAYGASEVSVTTTRPLSRCSASRRTASSAFESIFTTGNFSSRSSARTPTQYVRRTLSVTRRGLGISQASCKASARPLSQNEIAQPQIADGNDKRDRGHGNPSLGEVPKGHWTARPLRDPDDNDI